MLTALTLIKCQGLLKHTVAYPRDSRDNVNMSDFNYIVFDLEWNQGNSAKETQDPAMPFEIIEIGAIKLNSKREQVDSFSSLVRPTRYQYMHYVTGKLLHLRMEDLADEAPFPEVFARFMEWCGDEPYRFCSWGPLDLTELQRNMNFHGIAPLISPGTGEEGRKHPGPMAFYDAQKLFSLAYEDGKSRRSLENAVEMRGLDKPIPFHRAMDDAYYTAEIFAALPETVLEKVSFDYFHIPADREHEVHITFDTYAKFISMGFKDRSQLLSDREVMKTVCWRCGTELSERSVPWFTNNGRHFLCVSRCPRHGYMKSKVRIRKAETASAESVSAAVKSEENEEVYAVRTDKFIGAEELEAVKKRAEKALKRERTYRQHLMSRAERPDS